MAAGYGISRFLSRSPLVVHIYWQVTHTRKLFALNVKIQNCQPVKQRFWWFLSIDKIAQAVPNCGNVPGTTLQLLNGLQFMQAVTQNQVHPLIGQKLSIG